MPLALTDAELEILMAAAQLAGGGVAGPPCRDASPRAARRVADRPSPR
jgi:hypothetical protein